MSERDFKEVRAEEERRLLRSWGYWDLVVLGALMGAGLGYFYGSGDEARRQALDLFAGLGIGAAAAFSIGWTRAKRRARKLFFATWAASRGWGYQASGLPFADTPLLKSGDTRQASDFFSGFWPEAGAILYQHKRIVGSGRDEQITNYLVLHFVLERPPLLVLQIHPRGLIELGEKLLGQDEMVGTPLELESAELSQHFRISYVGKPGTDIRSLFTPSAIVKFLDFIHALSGKRHFFELEGMSAAFAIELTISPERPEEITTMIEFCRPIFDWLAGSTVTRDQAPL
ncbi:MAG: hypothetical protein ABSC51_11010 [Gaiellaceae bacterium]|jgi:hypothetical protein